MRCIHSLVVVKGLGYGRWLEPATVLQRGLQPTTHQALGLR